MRVYQVQVTISCQQHTELYLYHHAYAFQEYVQCHYVVDDGTGHMHCILTGSLVYMQVMLAYEFIVQIIYFSISSVSLTDTPSSTTEYWPYRQVFSTANTHCTKIWLAYSTLTSVIPANYCITSEGVSALVLRFLGSVSFMSSVHMLWPYFNGLALGIACLVVLFHQYVIPNTCCYLCITFTTCTMCYCTLLIH